jgi:hypothetical protein
VRLLGQMAGGEVVRPDLPERRYLSAASGFDAGLCRAARGHLRAPWVEPAASRDLRRIRRLADQDAPAGQVAAGFGDDLEQSFGVRVERFGEDLLGGAELDDLAQIHDGDSVGDGPGQA